MTIHNAMRSECGNKQKNVFPHILGLFSKFSTKTPCKSKYYLYLSFLKEKTLFYFNINKALKTNELSLIY
jgi:hypothetical protein